MRIEGRRIESDDDMGNLSASERHRLRRRQLEQEREERKLAEMERERKRTQTKTSDKYPAKWYLTGGVKIAGTAVRGMFYGGANTKNMIAPSIPEPSLLNPIEPVADSSDEMEPLGEYPMYQYISPEQRRGYIDFMASDRTSAKDIGFVFLYLYGFERRLIIDAQKPGEVTDEERDILIAELVRLYKTFGPRSRSLCHYIAALLLYDGRAFDTLDEDLLDEIFELSSKSQSTSTKSREPGDNADAMSYMLVSRLKEHKMRVPTLDIIASAKGRLLRGSNASMLGITKGELYEEKFDRLLRERVGYCDMRKLAKATARSVTPPKRPTYYPASPMIRKSRSPEITSAVCKDPEEMGVPLKGLADMIVTCKRDLEEGESVLSTESVRDIDRVELDALSVLSGGKGLPLDEFLSSKSSAIYVPVSLLEEDIKMRFKTPISYTAKGVMSANSQALVAAAAASLGWQAMLPEVIDGMVPSYWRVEKGSDIVMFERKIAHSTKNGKRRITPVFGHDEQTFRLTIPGKWDRTSCLIYIYAWFVSKCQGTLDSSYLTHFARSHYPEYSTKNGGYKENQIAFFFSLLHATYSMKLSTHGIKNCIKGAIEFSDVQDVIFSLCNEVYGKMIPQEAMEAIEDIYKKAGKDPSMILYDYNSGSYQVTSGTDIGFAIDQDKLADTIKDTQGVQSILNEAMKAGDDDEIILDGGASSIGQGSVDFEDRDDDEMAAADKTADAPDANADNDTGSEGGGAEGADADGGGDVARALEIIKEFFGDGDEGTAEDLLAKIVGTGLASTTAEAMGVISRVNEGSGDELVEIDGPDAYWNG